MASEERERLKERLTALERRLDALEGSGSASGPLSAPRPSPDGRGPEFWALNGLKEQVAAAGAEDGAVLFTGAVRLPTGERYEWQETRRTADVTEDLVHGGSADDATGPPGPRRTAEALAALGHPVRLRLLGEIITGRRTAAELAGLDGMGTTGQIYHHLRQLTAAGWLVATGRGRYEVPATRVVPLLTVLAAAGS
ncbi:helix-turn-helix domain-containing protein [Streptomyces sp. LP05-1]|uniref:Helix-turn-helix domain-containing protein n=1 Tax=Streptomyces pyxinae TaxID=2970734 RepID=A0ABT2CN41_9ACTN|nr:winged helix-turn-helix domain-containing protein [Streptomyces sp. LP05-1]MCS0638853.1 helix-turn-helix domain-containing protein [Streptomyces sp. LP05-1]